VSENLVSIRVWGDFACFTRPEIKVERVSYPLMTPSAARGVLEAIFWEPQMLYLIDCIRVVRRGRWVSFRRNEVKSVVNTDKARKWMTSPDTFEPIQAGAGEDTDCAQRNMLALEDVEYVIRAEVRLSELGRRTGQVLPKYLDEFERRAKQGKCFHRPVLGVREFAASFEWIDDATRIRLVEWPKEELGLMLYDVFDPCQRAQGFRWLSDQEMERSQAAHAANTERLPKGRRRGGSPGPIPRHEGRPVKAQAAFFHARIKDAHMDCHPDRVQIIWPKSREVF